MAEQTNATGQDFERRLSESDTAVAEFETEIRSDSAALHGLVAEMIAAVPDIKVLRDPTRGGLAATLNEIAHSANVGMMLDEAAIPVKPDVAAACELLGLDPLHVANEGRFVAFVAAKEAERAVDVLRAFPVSAGATQIGAVTEGAAGQVTCSGALGVARIVDMLSGEQLPRIC